MATWRLSTEGALATFAKRPSLCSSPGAYLWPPEAAISLAADHWWREGASPERL